MILGCKLPDLGLCITSICVPMWTSLAVHWLIVCASTAEGVGSIPGWGTKILHAVWCGRKKKVCANVPFIPWTEEPGRLPSMGSQRVGHS